MDSEEKHVHIYKMHAELKTYTESLLFLVPVDGQAIAKKRKRTIVVCRKDSLTYPINCVFISEIQTFRHKMQQKHPEYKPSTQNCARGFHILVHNKYLYIPQFSRFFRAVRVVKL